ncbi:MAG: hypothetical protein JSV14_10825 [Deltaproteobacteria bacterium]|nr:MAG: hypothetical protein JSV14_10825 [Deltaproteobacteria bacterium]
MRRPRPTIVALICLFVAVSCFGFAGTGHTVSGEKFLTAGSYINIWVLNKETRKMMFVSFQEADELWKSQVVTIPAHYNLDKCVLSAAGGRGKAVFLHDSSSGMKTMFLVDKNRTVVQFMELNGTFELR